MADWNTITEKKEALLSDLRHTIQRAPDRGRDLKVFMRLYLREDAQGGYPEKQQFYLDNLLRCAAKQDYERPYVYTPEDIDDIGKTLDGYLAAMRQGCSEDTCERLRDKLISAITELDSRPDKRILNAWREETLEELTCLAAEYAQHIHKQQPDFQVEFRGYQDMGGM